MTDKDTMMTLKTQADGADGLSREEADDTASSGHARAQNGPPLLGWFAVGFGVLGIFTFAPVFVPLALIFGLIAIFAGQVLLGLMAVVLSLVGVLTSPSLMLILGVGAFAAWLGIPI